MPLSTLTYSSTRPPLSTPGTTPAPLHHPTPRNSSPPPIPLPGCGPGGCRRVDDGPGTEERQLRRAEAPAPLLHSQIPMLYPEPTQSPLYALPLPLSPAPGQLVIPPYTPHNGQLWFAPPQPPAYINSDPLYYQPPPLRPASANPNPNLNNPPPMILSGLPVSGTPDHVLSSSSQQQHQRQQQTIIGHGALAARISHHLCVTLRARSVSPPPFEVELLSPKPLPSPKLTTAEEDPFAALTTPKR